MAPRLVLAVVASLPDTSYTAALIQGGPEFSGWGVDRHLAASIFDALNQNTVATGQWKKVPKIDPFPRPGDAKEKEKPPSLRDIWARLPKAPPGEGPSVTT